MTNAYLGAVFYALGDCRSPLEGLKETLASLQGELLHERYGQWAFPSVISRTWSAWCLAELGQLSEATAVGEEGMRIAETAGHPGSMTYSIWGASYAYLLRGDFPKAISALEQGLEVAEGSELRVLFQFLTSQLGRAYSFAGRHAESLPLHERSVRETESLGGFYFKSLFVGWQGESFLLAERQEEAIKCAQRSLELSRGRKERGSEAWALRLLGEIHSCLDAEKAEDHYRGGLTRAKELACARFKPTATRGSGASFRRPGGRKRPSAS